MKSLGRVFVAIVILVFAVLSFYLYRYYERVFQAKPEPKIERKIHKPMSQVASKQIVPPELIYPLSEKKFKVDFIDPNVPKIQDKLIVSSLNDEVLFCLREVLEDEKVDFAYHRQEGSEGSLVDIIIYLGDKSQRIRKLLDYYEIPYKPS